MRIRAICGHLQKYALKLEGQLSNRTKYTDKDAGVKTKGKLN